MTIVIDVLSGAALDAALPDLARLRITVFRAFPYLYDGSEAYEQSYLKAYRDNPRAILVAARQGDRIVGAATGMPLADHDDARQIDGAALTISDVFYCAESVLLPEFRGQGIGHAFFDQRETFATDLGFKTAAFCSVIRSTDHPLRPDGYRPLDAFWRKRGYAPVAGSRTQFSWTDVGDQNQSVKDMQYWSRNL